MSQLLTISEASQWAAKQFKKNITTSNISYLIQYERINKNDDDRRTLESP